MAWRSALHGTTQFEVALGVELDVEAEDAPSLHVLNVDSGRDQVHGLHRRLPPAP